MRLSQRSALALPLSLVSVAAAAPSALAAGPVSLEVADGRLTAGETLRASGAVGDPQPGDAVALQLQRTDGSWIPLDSVAPDPGGRVAFAVRPSRSGLVRLALNRPGEPAPTTSDASPVAVAASLRPSTRGLDLLRGSRGTVTGVLRPGQAGRRVTLERRAAGGRWRSVARATTKGSGRFSLRLRGAKLGSAALRVSFAGDRLNAPAHANAGQVTVYRPAGASYYGPGFYGGSLACGGRLRRGTLGVANKHLPCGTPVTLRHGGRSITVPVIDRGPYVAGREYDLTAATARRVGFGGTGAIWASR